MITLIQSNNIPLIEHIGNDPELYDRISDDQSINDMFRYEEGTVYLLIKTDEGVIGFFSIEQMNGITLVLHTNILHQFRKEYSHYAAIEIHRWFVYICAGVYKKIIAYIPEVYPDVCGFALKHGYTKEGHIKDSIMKKGKLGDMLIFGCTRDQSQQYLGDR